MGSNSIEKTKELMGALARMKPKPHEQMKVGKKTKEKAKKTKKAGKKDD